MTSSIKALRLLAEASTLTIRITGKMIDKLILAIGLATVTVVVAAIINVVGYMWSFAALLVIFSIMPIGERN